MSKFGADTEDFTIGMGKYGPCHITKSGTEGRLAQCRRNPASCKFCHEHGVPQNEPDPYDVARERLRANRLKRWQESDRQCGALAEDEIWPADGLHIVAIDPETGARTVLLSFGVNDAATASITAIVDDHNEIVPLLARPNCDADAAVGDAAISVLRQSLSIAQRKLLARMVYQPGTSADERRFIYAVQSRGAGLQSCAAFVARQMAISDDYHHPHERGQRGYVRLTPLGDLIRKRILEGARRESM